MSELIFSLSIVLMYASYYLAEAYRKIYKSFLTKELDKINYKFYYKSDSIDDIEEFCSIIIYIPIINVIYSIIKYNPFNMERVIENLIERGIVVEMTAKQIQKRDKKKLKQETKKSDKKKLKPKKIETKVKQVPKIESEVKVVSERSKNQVSFVKELDNSDATLVLKIQTLLVKLRKINPEIYESFNKEYEELAKSGKLSNFMLKELLARILCSLEYDIRDARTLINYLDYLIVSYENKTPINNQISELSFKELENIAREIINTSNLYTREDKVIIYKKLSLLYLYFIYDNKYLNIDAIRNSCFNHEALLYAVILNIDDLIKRNLIEDNLLFDVNEQYDLESILKLINEIKFNNKKEKKLMY